MPLKKIKSYEEACKALNLDATLPEFPMLSEKERKAMQAHYKLVVIAKALNGDWVPDWSNLEQDKCFPWFAFRGGRSVFDDVVYYCTWSDLGSRLCYKDRATAQYAGETFAGLYDEYFSIE